MTKLIVHLLICLAPVISQHLVRAIKFEPASNLHLEFSAINKALNKALPQDKLPEKNLLYLKQSEEENRHEKDKESFLKAVRLIISLEKTIGECNLNSAIILVANHQANVGLLEQNESASRIGDIIEYYRTKYAAGCREYFQREFSRLKRGISDEDLDRVEAAFKSYVGVDPNPLMDDLEPAGYLRGSLKMQSISLASQKGLVDLVVDKIGEELRKLPALKMRYDRDRQKYVLPKLTKKVYEDHLIVPCDNFRLQLASVLDPARLDMLLVNESDPKEVETTTGIMLRDEFYYRFMIYNRFCETLLNDNLYDVFSESWENYLLTKGL